MKFYKPENPLDIADRAYFAGKKDGIEEALAQPETGCAECGKKASDGWALYCVACMEQESTEWKNMVVNNLVRHGINKHKARELADYFYIPLASKPWIGLTDQDKAKLIFAADSYLDFKTIETIEAASRSKNT